MELSEAAKEKRREYARQYYKRFPEKRKEWTRRFWERKALAEQGGAPDGAETIEPDRGTDDNK